MEMTRKRYLDVEMPERFMLQIRDESARWLQWGVYWAKHFSRREDGTYLCAGTPYGSPTWIRCIAHRDGYFEHIDEGGHGNVYAYRLVPLPAPTSEPAD
jgi:hypothetical protein